MANDTYLAQLDQSLATLTNSKQRLGVESVAGEREKLLKLDGKFNDVASPAAEKLAAALPHVYDYGSKWVTARMLQNIALQDDSQKNIAFDALRDYFIHDKDSGTRGMAATLLRNMGLKYPELATTAAGDIATVLATEKDAYSAKGMQGSLMMLAVTHQGAATITAHSTDKLLQKEKDVLSASELTGNLHVLGTQYPEIAPLAIDTLVRKLDGEKDNVIARKVAQTLSDLGAVTPALVPVIITALQKAAVESPSHEILSAATNSLQRLSGQHGAAVITAAEQSLETIGTTGNALKRHQFISTINNIGQDQDTFAPQAAQIMMRLLENETDAQTKRSLAKNIADFARSGAITSKTAADALQAQIDAPNDVETKIELVRLVRVLGHEKKFQITNPPPRMHR